LFAFGCAGAQLPPVPKAPGQLGSDRDSHGCIGSAGYSWCEEKQKCIRPWEESCTSKLRVLTESFPPFNYMGSNGEIAGQSTKIVREIMRRTGTSAQIELLNWPDAYSLASAGPNTLLYSTGRTPERESLFKWIGPLGDWDLTFYSPAATSFSLDSLGDAKKFDSICVVKDDTRQQFLVDNNFTNLYLAKNDAECAKRLADGKGTLWLGSTTSFAGIMKDAGLNTSSFNQLITVKHTGLYIAFSKDVPDSMVFAWQSALDAMGSDGTLDAISESYRAESGFPTMVGNDRDSHGCIGSAGYTWCEAKQKCIRPWEENCTAELVGGDRDAHGCIPSAGYQWCQEKQKCLQVWEEACPSLTAAALLEQAKTYCANGSTVYTCGEYIKVVSSMPGAGSKFYKLGDYNAPITCPVVAPDSMSTECRLLLLGNNCVDVEVDCGNAVAPSAINDLRDDPNYVGAQLSWSKPSANAVDYNVYRGNEGLTIVSLITTTGQATYNDVFDGGNRTYAYFVRARNAAGAQSESSNVIYVQQLSTKSLPSPGQVD